MKSCPFCAEEIQDAAVVCKHCGRDIPQRAEVATPTITPPTPVPTIKLVMLLVVVTGLFFFALVYRSSAPSAPSADGAATRDVPVSVETKLATVDCNCPVSEGDVRALRFRSLLDDLSGKWYEGPQKIADISVAARNSLREKGISETILNIMEGLSQAPNTPFANFGYAEHVAMYVTLRGPGKSHDAAVSELSKAMQGQALRELRSK